ncbi:hypothetical protein Tco_0749891 [Tanacetum coccineum]|uniref:FHA domain-containing protein n=1 Tax=Tanacetum coccineum TaxID=301880 RepID=A0ABQ4Z2K3_9ASTR
MRVLEEVFESSRSLVAIRSFTFTSLRFSIFLIKDMMQSAASLFFLRQNTQVYLEYSSTMTRLTGPYPYVSLEESSPNGTLGPYSFECDTLTDVDLVFLGTDVLSVRSAMLRVRSNREIILSEVPAGATPINLGRGGRYLLREQLVKVDFTTGVVPT